MKGLRMAIKLSKLPKRTPVKMNIILNPETHKAMVDYARIYEETYGCEVVPKSATN